MKNINFIRIFIILFLVAFQTQAQKKTLSFGLDFQQNNYIW